MTEQAIQDARPYPVSSLRQMLGLSRHAIAKLVQLRLVEPARSRGRALRFSFRDVVLLHSAHDLRGAGIATRQILRSLRRLREVLPQQAPIGGLRVTPGAGQLVVVVADALPI